MGSNLERSIVEEEIEVINNNEGEDVVLINDVFREYLPSGSVALILRKEVASSRHFLIAFKSFIIFSGLNINSFFFCKLKFLESFFIEELNDDFFLSFADEKFLFSFIYYFFFL